MVEQHGLGLDHVADGDDREVEAQGRPVAGLVSLGPVVAMQPPSALLQITKWRSVSKGLPGPTISSHQPGLPVTGWGPRTNWSPVSA